MAININRDSREYIQKNPIRSSIGAVGYGTCQGINLIVDVVDISRDVIKLAKFSIRESLIEAETESMKAELQGTYELGELRDQLAQLKLKTKA